MKHNGRDCAEQTKLELLAHQTFFYIHAGFALIAVRLGWWLWLGVIAFLWCSEATSAYAKQEHLTTEHPE